MLMKKLLTAVLTVVSIAATNSALANNIKNQPITIKSIKLKDGKGDASITVMNGTVWVFNGKGTPGIGLKVNGAPASPKALVTGQNCMLNGVRSDSGGANIIHTLDCK